MTNEEIYEMSHGTAVCSFSTIKESEQLVHWVSNGGGFMRLANPNGGEFFAAIFPSDNEAFEVIDAIKESILNGGDDESLKNLCVKLDECLPIIDGIKYVMAPELAYYLVRTHRPMDDIYFYENKSTDKKYDRRLIEYVSGKYAA